ncbi:MAG: DUF1801 domain-containing protein [Cocleimonas sp.]
MELSVKQKFETYPDDVSFLLHNIRDLILRVAKDEGILDLTETLKWGQPSYISNIGSVVRFDWSANLPDQYCIFFNCNTTLVETFKEVFGDTFMYEGNRAIVLKKEQTVPLKELEHCISLSLRYKKIKHLNLLGS